MKQHFVRYAVLLFSAGVFLRLLFALLTPIGGTSVAGKLSSYNDEYAHASYVEFVQRTGKLPSQVEPITAPDALNRALYENYQPPLYYLTISSLSFILDIRDMRGIIFTGRIVSILLFLLMGWVYLRIVRELHLDNDVILSGLVFLALGGVFVRFSSMLNNEALFWPIAGYFMLQSIRIERSGWGLGAGIGLTIAAIAGLYSKFSMVLLLPLPLLLWQGRDGKRWSPVFGFYLAVLLGTLPLWMRNLNHFGALLPLEAGFGPSIWQIPFHNNLSFAVRSFIFPWNEFWAGFVGVVVMLPFVASALINLRKGFKIVSASRSLSGALILSLIGYFWLNLHYAQADARYLFAAWPAIGILLSAKPLRNRTLWIWMIAVLLPYCLLFLPI